MEQQEEKKRKESTSSLPPDLASEILLKLPAKSVVRFGCVSKLWSSITTDPYFTKPYETRSSTQPSLLLFFKHKHKLFAFSMLQNHQNLNKPQHVGTYHMKYADNYFYFTESVKGLICFLDSAMPIVWNPTLRQFLTLLKPEKSWNDITMYLGYDPVEGQDKVMCRPANTILDECRVLTLGPTQESWRTMKTDHKHHSRRNGRCINGVVYYKAYDEMGVSIIMSFDDKVWRNIPHRKDGMKHD